MPAYIANHQKKNRIFAKRERVLLHALKHGLNDEKIAKVAEKLREAKMNVFKCQYSKDSARQPHSFSPKQAADHDLQVKKWLSMPTSEIVALYRLQLES